LREVFPVAPGGGLVVEGAGLQASVQDADEAVREPAERVAVVVSFGALLVVEGARSGGCLQRGEGPGHQGVDEPVVVDEPGGDDLLLAGGTPANIRLAISRASLCGIIPLTLTA